MNEQELLTEIKRLEGIYMQPQDFKQYKNYWLPESIVKESTNVLSLSPAARPHRGPIPPMALPQTGLEFIKMSDTAATLILNMLLLI